MIGVAGCGRQDSDASTVVVSGTITDLEDAPVPEATVQLVTGGKKVVAETASGEDGRFEASTDRSLWLRVDHPNYISRVRAIEPGSETTVRLTEDTGTTVSLGFGGDVMFGRRFYETGGDGLSNRARIDPGALARSHQEILQYVQPLFEQADIASVNLETPLTTTDWTYPEKSFQFTSHPAAAEALSSAGVDYAALGNNHVFDALTPGLEETNAALDRTGIARSGAGMSSDEAWQPATFSSGDLRIEYLSCTTIVGDQYEIDWSADRIQSESHTVRQNGNTLTVPGGAGVAEATERKLKTEVTRASERADIVVVQIHGGNEYQQQPPESLRQLTDAAAMAGADLVVNHHPHVTGGLERRDDTLVAWSLGNLVFDQVLWETLRSYWLVAHVDGDGVRRVLLEPILLEGYVPKGVSGTVREKLGWDTAALSTGVFRDGTAIRAGQIDAATGPSPSEETLEGPDATFRRDVGGHTEVIESTGTVEVGRDRLYTGSFENMLVDDGQYTAPLWRLSRTPSATGESVGRDSGGVRVTSYRRNTRRSILTPASRVPVKGSSYTLTGWFRSDAESDAQLLIPWYEAASGSSFARDLLELSPTDDEWEPFRTRVQPPNSASFVNVFAFLSPPTNRDSHSIRFDDVRLIEWEAPATDSTRYHDYIHVEDSATVRTKSPNGGDTPTWTEI